MLGGAVRSVVPSRDTHRQRALYEISTIESLSSRLAKDRAFLFKERNAKPVHKFKHYFALESLIPDLALPQGCAITAIPDDYSYLNTGDIVRLEGSRQRMRVLFRKESPHNTLLLTEQCNHYCLMCSQPPKQRDDSWLLDEARELVRMLPDGIGELGFSGGEPTLYGDGFIDLMRLTANHLPRTSLHILTNGRRFSDRHFAHAYSQVAHFDKMVGIPIYSDDPLIHDYVVQAKNAFDETIVGILNLKRLKQQVEIRVVIHKQTVGTLESLAQFIAKNLLFVNHVALMGLEITGFTRANLGQLWIDPNDYKNELAGAVRILSERGIRTSIYNHPLCLVPETCRSAYRKSISDWKNEYLDDCSRCTRKSECGGFFASGVRHRHTAHVKPFQ